MKLRFLLLPVTVALSLSPAFGQVLTNESFVISSGAGQSGAGTQTSCMIMSDGTSWSGGAVGVQGPSGLAVGNSHALAANVTFKFGVGAAVDLLNTKYGAGHWTISNATLRVQYTLYANNNRFNSGAGTFDIYWVANDGWVQGTTNPVYATNGTLLSAWSGSQSLLASEYYPWTTPTYVGTNADISSGVWVTDKTGARQATNTYALPLAASFLSDVVGASASSNANVSLYLMATSPTMGICIFTGGAAFLPTFSFDVVPVPEIPVMVANPSDQIVAAGSALNISAAVTGVPALGCQWYFNSNAISGAISATYAVASADVTNSGYYFVLATNAYGSVTSSVALITVKPVPALALASSQNPSGYKGAVFFTAALTPADATGTVSFATNGVVFDTETLAGGTATSVAIDALPAGTNLVAASYSGDSVYWSSTNALSEVVTNRVISVAGIAAAASGSYSLQFAGVPGTTYWVEAATNLAAPVWLPVTTNTAGADGTWQFSDASAASSTARFYRVHQP